MAENPFLWSITASDNDDADPAVPWPEGMNPGSVNNAARSMMAGVARLVQDMNGSVGIFGGPTTYTITSNCGHTTYVHGTMITGICIATNTGASTLNMNGFGAKPIRIYTPSGESEVAAGQMKIGGIYQFAYNLLLANSGNGAWILLNPSPDPTASAMVGDIKIWSADTAPANWVYCNGQQISRTLALFSIIGTTYGIGDGSTTFNVPDLCGRFPLGSDDMNGITPKGRVTSAGSGIDGTVLGATGGLESITLSTSQIPAITPAGTVAYTPAGTIAYTPAGTISQITPAGTNSAPGITFSASGTNSYTPTGTNAASSVTSGSTANISVFTTGAGGGSNRFLADIATGVTVTFGVTGTAAAQTFTGNAVTASASAPTFTGSAVTPTFTGTAGAPVFTGTAGAPVFTGTPFGGGTAHSNMPPALVINYMIKYQ